MNIVVAGSRTFTDYNLLETTLDELISKYNITEPVIVSGTCSGADKLGEWYAYNRNYKVLQFKPDWKKYGKGAGFIRNKAMGDNSDILVAFWDGKSQGTKNMIEIMQKQNKPIIIKYF